MTLFFIVVIMKPNADINISAMTMQPIIGIMHRIPSTSTPKRIVFQDKSGLNSVLRILLPFCNLVTIPPVRIAENTIDIREASINQTSKIIPK